VLCSKISDMCSRISICSRMWYVLCSKIVICVGKRGDIRCSMIGMCSRMWYVFKDVICVVLKDSGMCCAQR
jgi:hypothetical protein